MTRTRLALAETAETSRSAAPPLRGLPTRQVVTPDGPRPPVELVPSTPGPSQVRPRRPCPPRARSTGNWRSLTDNNGRSKEALTCGSGVASGQDDGADAPSKLGTAGATSGPQMTGSQRTTPVNTGPPSAEVTRHTPPPAAGRRDPPAVPDTEEVTGSNPVAPTRRNASIDPPLSAVLSRVMGDISASADRFRLLG